MYEDGLGHGGEVLVEERDDLLRLHLLRHRGEAADVGEEHGERAAGAPELDLVLVADDLLDDGGGEEPREPALLPLLADEVLHHRGPEAEEEGQRSRGEVHPQAPPGERGEASGGQGARLQPRPAPRTGDVMKANAY